MINNIVKKIKEYIEIDTSIEDLSVKSRERHIAEARYVAFKLTKVLCPSMTLRSIGTTYNKHHSTVNNGIKQFDFLENQKSFEPYKKLYLKIHKEISENKKLDYSIIFKNEEDIKSHYRIKHFKMQRKYRGLIEKQRRKLVKYKNSSLFDKINELEGKERKDLEDRINAFLLMNTNNKY